MTVEVRLLRDGDQALLGRALPEAFDKAVDPALADAFLRDPHHHIVAAVAEERVIGFVSAVEYWHPDKPRELFINEVGVVREHQGSGIGRQLMAAMLGHGRDLGCVDAWVLTDPANSAANALYAGTGGVRDGSGFVMYTFPLSPDGARQTANAD